MAPSAERGRGWRAAGVGGQLRAGVEREQSPGAFRQGRPVHEEQLLMATPHSSLEPLQLSWTFKVFQEF